MTATVCVPVSSAVTVVDFNELDLFCLQQSGLEHLSGLLSDHASRVSMLLLVFSRAA